MSLNKQRDLKSRSKRRRSESERAANKHDLADRPREHKNKRQKSKRAASPTLSYLSMKTDWSMDPPTNFRSGETFPLHSRTKRRRQTSPVTSYMSLKSGNTMDDSRGNTSILKVRAASPTLTLKTDWSMDPPTNFKAGLTFPLHARERAVSPTPTLKTDWSMDPPTNFKPAETFPLDSRLLTEHHLRCPLCKSMLKDPVSISCGHNYCRDCIDAFWDNCAEDYVCPQCGKSSETRPVLNINTALAEVVKNLQQAGFSPALPPQSCAGPEDVACDFCSERRLKAVKSCSTCNVFLCETHIRQHYTIPALQKHTLYDVTGDMKTKPSQQQNTVNSFSGFTSGQQNQMDKAQVIIKEMPVKSFLESVLNAAKLQARPKKSVKFSRPKPKYDVNIDDVKDLAHACSTLRQEVSGLKKSLSKFSKGKNTKKEKYYEDDYGDEDDDDEDCSEKDSDERSDDEERDEDSHDEDEDGSAGSRDEEDEGSDGSENSYDEEDDFDGSENRYDEEDDFDGSENRYDEEDDFDGSENRYDEEDDFDEEEGDEGSRDDEEENSEYSDEGSDDRYSDGYNDHSSEEYSCEEDEY